MVHMHTCKQSTHTVNIVQQSRFQSPEIVLYGKLFSFLFYKTFTSVKIQLICVFSQVPEYISQYSFCTCFQMLKRPLHLFFIYGADNGTPLRLLSRCTLQLSYITSPFCPPFINNSLQVLCSLCFLQLLRETLPFSVHRRERFACRILELIFVLRVVLSVVWDNHQQEEFGSNFPFFFFFFQCFETRSLFHRFA